MSFDLSWLWNTLTSIGGSITSWFGGIWEGAVKTLENVGQGILSAAIAFGSAIWDALTKVAGAAIGIVMGIWNAIVSWFVGLASAIGSWWAGVINGINAWFTNLLRSFRAKMRATIIADISIANTWKAGERILHAQSFKDVAFGGMGLIASPLIGWLVGTIIDSLIPTPSTSVYPLIPDIGGLVPPTQGITIPAGVTMPVGTSGGVFTGVADKIMPIGLTKDVTIASTDKTCAISLSNEVEVA